MQKLQQDVKKLKQSIEQIKTHRLTRIKRQSHDKQIQKLIINNLITDSDFFNGKKLTKIPKFNTEMKSFQIFV